MSQDKKDELICSLPVLINEILGKNEGPFYMVLECLKVVKDQFYDGCAAELLKLIKEHTEKVNTHTHTHTHFFLIHTTFDSFFFISTEKGCSKGDLSTLRPFYKHSP